MIETYNLDKELTVEKFEETAIPLKSELDEDFEDIETIVAVALEEKIDDVLEEDPDN
jgi:hypothetical protein